VAGRIFPPASYSALQAVEDKVTCHNKGVKFFSAQVVAQFESAAVPMRARSLAPLEKTRGFGMTTPLEGK